jgi:uncharacterized SAM-binding protein YcdF (DUF218 family)
MDSHPAIGAPLPNVLLQWRQPGQLQALIAGLTPLLIVNAIAVPSLLAYDGGRWALLGIPYVAAITIILAVGLMWLSRPRRVEISPAGIRVDPTFYPWREVVSYGFTPRGSLSLHVRRRIETWGMDGTFVVLPFPPELRSELEPLLANYVGSLSAAES